MVISFSASKPSSKAKFIVERDIGVYILNTNYGNKCQEDILSENLIKKYASNWINLISCINKNRDTLHETSTQLTKAGLKTGLKIQNRTKKR